MKIFFAVLGALLVAMFVGFCTVGYFAYKGDQLRQWEIDKNKTVRQMQESLARLSGDDAEDKDEKELQRLLIKHLAFLYEHKPSDLSAEEELERSKFREAYANAQKLADANPAPSERSRVISPETKIPELQRVPAVTPPPSAAFVADVGFSQRAALAKYPQLGVKGSPLNARFLARLDQWKARNDQRLSRSDWPEKLAADCAEHP